MTIGVGQQVCDKIEGKEQEFVLNLCWRYIKAKSGNECLSSEQIIASHVAQIKTISPNTNRSSIIKLYLECIEKVLTENGVENSSDAAQALTAQNKNLGLPQLNTNPKQTNLNVDYVFTVDHIKFEDTQNKDTRSRVADHIILVHLAQQLITQRESAVGFASIFIQLTKFNLGITRDSSQDTQKKALTNRLKKLRDIGLLQSGGRTRKGFYALTIDGLDSAIKAIKKREIPGYEEIDKFKPDALSTLSELGIEILNKKIREIKDAENNVVSISAPPSHP